MVRFVRAELELLAKRRPFSQKSLAELAGVSESQASRWHAVPGFDDWHHDQLQAAAVRLFNQGKVAVGNRILMTGDPKELEVLARVLGLLTSAPDAGQERPAGLPPVQFNFLVPRPEYPPGSSSVPMLQRLPPPDLAPELGVELASRSVQKRVPD
jgi:hypothetical protein